MSTETLIAVLVLAWLPVAYLAVRVIRARRKAAEELAREQGALAVQAVLLDIPGSAVFRHVSIDFNGRLGGIDLMIIRDNGVFAVEVVPCRGTLHVSNATHWRVEGGPRGEVRNPIAHLMRNIRTLKERMESQPFPIRPQIEAVVCLPEPTARVSVLEPQKVPVLRLDQLAEYLQARPSQSPRSDHEAAKLRTFLLDNGMQCEVAEKPGGEQEGGSATEETAGAASGRNAAFHPTGVPEAFQNPAEK